MVPGQTEASLTHLRTSQQSSDSSWRGKAGIQEQEELLPYICTFCSKQPMSVPDCLSTQPVGPAAACAGPVPHISTQHGVLRVSTVTKIRDVSKFLSKKQSEERTSSIIPQIKAQRDGKKKLNSFAGNSLSVTCALNIPCTCVHRHIWGGKQSEEVPIVIPKKV